MHTLAVPEDAYRKLEAFTNVYRAVMDDDADLNTSLAVFIDLGFKAALETILAQQGEPVLLESIQQLAADNPEIVCRYIADRIGLGADIRSQAARERPASHD